jgi:hypothetical protein
MGGGLMQLVAYGAQDIYLTGNPQITFFKVVYRRHTNFAMEAIEQTYTGQAELGKRFTVTVARNGDLLGRVYLETDVTLAGSNSEGLSDAERNRVGHKMIDYVEVEIGGQIIDKHYGIWMDIWCQLTHSQEQWTKLVRMIDGSLDVYSSTNAALQRLYVPLQFWFCRNPGLYLPLIALQYHEVKFNIQLNDASKTGNPAEGLQLSSINSMKIYCDYIFLDTDERRRFAQVSHEYLIEQVQYNNAVTITQGQSTLQTLRFNHPCKELIWVVQKADWSYDFSCTVAGEGDNIDWVKSALLQLNGQDRFKRREGTYFRCVQPYQHHTGAFLQGGNSGVGDAYETGFIYVYSFAIKPEEHQPSGTCNFSRIDNTVLSLDVNTSTTDNATPTLKVYVVNYNVLRIMSGMGGLAYSN